MFRPKYLAFYGLDSYSMKLIVKEDIFLFLLCDSNELTFIVINLNAI